MKYHEELVSAYSPGQNSWLLDSYLPKFVCHFGHFCHLYRAQQSQQCVSEWSLVDVRGRQYLQDISPAASWYISATRQWYITPAVPFHLCLLATFYQPPLKLAFLSTASFSLLFWPFHSAVRPPSQSITDITHTRIYLQLHPNSPFMIVYD